MFRAYLRWLNSRSRHSYRNTPLLGNPHEVVGHAPPPRRSIPPFSRASFGKYERRQRRVRWIKITLGLMLLCGLIWVTWESVQALGMFKA